MSKLPVERALATSPPTVHRRHQASLEGVIDFSQRPPLTAAQHASASRRFATLIERFDVDDGHDDNSGYDRVKLVRLTYEYARSEESKDNFLRAFFEVAAIPMDDEGEEDDDPLGDAGQLRDALNNFADYLFDNFFLPLKASTRKTPQPTPATHSAVLRTQSDSQSFLGTPERLSALRGSCLIRDRHRCVISRKFDRNEAKERFNHAHRHGDVARDDDKNPLEFEDFEYLEVAHIIPHSLVQLDKNNELEASKQAALAILNMFDNGVVHLIEGAEIDRPRNAITLTLSLHRDFGAFEVYFEPVDQQPHTYRIKTFSPQTLRGYPILRTLFLTESRTIDPPSPRLLAIHNAIAHILHLSGAGEYIDRILRDLEKYGVQADGSTALDRLVKLRLGGWQVDVAQ